MISRAGFLKRMAFAALACGLLDTRVPRFLRWEPDPTPVGLAHYSMDGGKTWTLVGSAPAPASSSEEKTVGALLPGAGPVTLVGSTASAGLPSEMPLNLPDQYRDGDLLIRVVEENGHAVLAFRGVDPQNPLACGPGEGMTVPMVPAPEFG